MKRQLRPKPAPFTVDTVETLPAACDAHDVGRVFNVSVKTVYGWHQSGRLRRFELAKPMGSRRWSGRLLQAFVNGESNPLEVIRRRSA
jgi:hypothetical protein